MAFNKTKALKLADKFISKQNYNKALSELLKVAKVTPNDVNLLNKIGDLYSKVGNTKSAIEYFTKVAESYQAGGFNLKAIALYKKIIRIDDTYTEARHRMVELFIQQGHHSEAKGELRRMAERFYNENLFARSLACYEKLVEIEPNNLDARIKITELLIKEGKRENATEHFIAMGRELLEKSMINEARKIIVAGIQIAPDSKVLLTLLSQCLLAEGKTDDALVYLTEICEKDDTNLEALRLLGQTYLNKGQLSEAKACCLRAYALSGKDTGLLEEVANRLIGACKVDEAFDCVQPLSEFFLAKQEYDSAIRLFRGILYVEENHIPSHEQLVQIYRTSQQTANAILTLEKIIQFYTDQGDITHVRDKIEELVGLDPNNQEWHQRLADLNGKGADSDFSSRDIHVFDDDDPSSAHTDTDMAGLAIEDSLMGEDLSVGFSGHDHSVEIENEEMRIANHLTEAEVLMKYGATDQAVFHLLEAQKLSPLNEKANTYLKQIYLKKQDIQPAVLCMVRLVNGAIENKDYQKAGEYIKEIEEHRPDIANQHRQRLASITGAGRASNVVADDAYSLDFGGPSAEQVNLQLNKPSNDDVMDFRGLGQQGGHEFNEDPANMAEESGGAWSLDMPGMDESFGEDFGQEPLSNGFDLGGLDEPSAGGRPGQVAQDFDDLYNPAEQTLSEGADELPGLDALRAGFAKDTDSSDRTEDFTDALDPSEIPSVSEDPADQDPVAPGEGPLSPTFGQDPPIEDSLGRNPFGQDPLEQDPLEEDPLEHDAFEPDPLDQDLLGLDPLGQDPLEDDDQSHAAAPESQEDLLVEMDHLPEPDPTEQTGFGLLDLEETGTQSKLEPLDDVPEPAPPDVEHAPLESSYGSLAGELEEIDFFISVEAFDDAASLISEARKHFGEHPLLLERVQEVASRTQLVPKTPKLFEEPSKPKKVDKVASPQSLVSDDGRGFFDLAAELSEELFEEEEIDVNDKTSREEIQSVEELFQEFKKGVDDQIDDTDHETHYDLGIAYKEMGLLEEAIEEFNKANRSPARFLDCATMIGNCLIELGRMQQTFVHFQTCLDQATDEGHRVALLYELGLAYQGAGELEKALEVLLEVQKTQPDYRDLEELIEALAV